MCDFWYSVRKGIYFEALNANKEWAESWGKPPKVCSFQAVPQINIYESRLFAREIFQKWKNLTTGVFW